MKPPGASSFERRLGKVLIGLSCTVAAATLGGRLGGLHWTADWLAYFHDAYFFCALGLGVGLLLLKKYTWAGLVGLVALFNALLLFPYLPAPGGVTAEADLRLYSHNLYYLNDDLDAVTADIERFDPDVVFLMEYSGAIGRAIEADFSEYPHRLIEPSRYTMGVAVFSRVPFETAEVVRLRATRIPVVRLEFAVNDQVVSFVGGHPWPPLPRWGGLHRAQMQTVTDVAAEAEGPLIVAGDFNASPWSYTVGRLRRAAGVHDARRGFGLRKTWRFAGVFALPIDQVLVSSEWRVLNVVHGDWGGSDHAPLVVDLALK